SWRRTRLGAVGTARLRNECRGVRGRARLVSGRRAVRAPIALTALLPALAVLAAIAPFAAPGARRRSEADRRRDGRILNGQARALRNPGEPGRHDLGAGFEALGNH